MSYSKRAMFLAIVLALLGATWCAGNRKFDRERKKTAALERKISEAAGLIVADPDAAFAHFADLKDQIDSIQVVVPDAEVVEEIIWMTNPINVDLKAIIERQRGALADMQTQHAYRIREAVNRVARDRPDCSGLMRPEDCPVWEIPEFKVDFTIGALEARLVSDSGNHFAAIKAHLYEGPCVYEDGELVEGSCTHVGSADANVGLTELVAKAAPAKVARLGWYGGLQYRLDSSSLTATAQSDCTYPGNADPPPFGCVPGSQTVFGDLSDWRLAFGPEWRWKRLALRSGVYVDDGYGLDFGLSFHRSR